MYSELMKYYQLLSVQELLEKRVKLKNKIIEHSCKIAILKELIDDELNDPEQDYTKLNAYKKLMSHHLAVKDVQEVEFKVLITYLDITKENK